MHFHRKEQDFQSKANFGVPISYLIKFQVCKDHEYLCIKVTDFLAKMLKNFSFEAKKKLNPLGIT